MRNELGLMSDEGLFRNGLDVVGGRCLQTADAIGLLSRLVRGKADPATLSEELEVSERGLRPLLYLLASVKVLSQDEKAYSLTPAGQEFLDTRWPQLKDTVPSAPDWEQLELAVRTGTCVRPAIEGQTDGGNFFSQIVDTLFRLHSPLAQAVADELPAGLRRVLDLGAGSAVWSLAYVRRHPGSEAVAVDHPKVLEEVTRRFLEDHKSAEQYELRPGSYHTVDLERDHYDLVYLGHVIHSEGWEASRSLLSRCLQALKPGGRLVVAEWVGSEPRSLDYHANLFDLNMLMFTEKGLVFTASEMEQLCLQAGFEIERWIKGPGQYPVLLARKVSEC